MEVCPVGLFPGPPLEKLKAQNLESTKLSGLHALDDELGIAHTSE